MKRATPWAGCTRWLPTEARGAAAWRVSSVYGTRRRRLTDRQCASTSTSRQRPARRSSGLHWAATRSSLAPTSSSTRPPHDSQVRYVPLHRPPTYAQSFPENVEHAAKLHGQVETLFPVVFGNNCFELDSMPVYGTIFQTWLQDHMILCWRSYVRGYASVPVNGPTWWVVASPHSTRCLLCLFKHHYQRQRQGFCSMQFYT